MSRIAFRLMFVALSSSWNNFNSVGWLLRFLGLVSLLSLEKGTEDNGTFLIKLMKTVSAYVPSSPVVLIETERNWRGKIRMRKNNFFGTPEFHQSGFSNCFYLLKMKHLYSFAFLAIVQVFNKFSGLNPMLVTLTFRPKPQKCWITHYVVRKYWK